MHRRDEIKRSGSPVHCNVTNVNPVTLGRCHVYACIQIYIYYTDTRVQQITGCKFA